MTLLNKYLTGDSQYRKLPSGLKILRLCLICDILRQCTSDVICCTPFSAGADLVW
jgi:hypothetical protein